jgi:hypothetical protein
MYRPLIFSTEGFCSRSKNLTTADIDFGWVNGNPHLDLGANDELAWSALLCARNLLKQKDHKYQYSLGHSKWPLGYTSC